MPGRLSGPVTVRLFCVMTATTVMAATVVATAVVTATVVAAAHMVGGGRRGGHGGRGLGHCGNRAEQGGGGKQVLFHK